MKKLVIKYTDCKILNKKIFLNYKNNYEINEEIYEIAIYN